MAATDYAEPALIERASPGGTQGMAASSGPGPLASERRQEAVAKLGVPMFVILGAHGIDIVYIVYERF